MKDILIILGFIVLAVLAIIFGPIFTIWAINALFGVGIPLNFWTWLSMLWLTIMVAPKVSVKSKG